jgi:hypothetical protein
MRHYDVQLIGGMVLHSGAIAEMITGEGKTLVATLPAYLNALEGTGVHVVTVNDYLARRDMEWMGPLYIGLGLTVGAIQSGMESGERQNSYACDITYGTNNEFGFDYLRDNMRMAARGDDRFPKHMQQSQGFLNFAIVDEVDNILIDEAGNVKLTDMGLAKGPADLTIPRDGATVGTPQYISPEQARNPHDVDVRTDLWSLGATLFHMAAGVPPFRGDTMAELITNVLNQAPTPPNEINPALSDGMSLVIRKLLAKDLTVRYQTPRDLLDDLDRIDRAQPPAVDEARLVAVGQLLLAHFVEQYAERVPIGRPRVLRGALASPMPHLGRHVARCAAQFCREGHAARARRCTDPRRGRHPARRGGRDGRSLGQ